jgi:histone deacetylase 11
MVKHGEQSRTLFARPLVRLPALFIIFFTLCYASTYAWVIGRASLLPAVPIAMPAYDAARVPVIYHPLYNLSLFGIEQVHPFDTYKYQKVYQGLLDAGRIQTDNTYSPAYASDDMLLSVHTREHLQVLEQSKGIARMTEIKPLALLPAGALRRAIVDPQRLATGGTVLAAELALKDGWAINLSGGYHHAAPFRAWGFCAVAWKHIRSHHPDIRRAMIVDLDAHQGDGNGYALGNDPDVFILDAYNPYVFPGDLVAAAGIDAPIHVTLSTSTDEYLVSIEAGLQQALEQFAPDMVFYLAGTDILDGDPLGGLKISSEGVMKRDAMVVRMFRSRGIPLVITLSGGYQPNNGPLLARSLDTLWPLLAHGEDSTNQSRLR